MVWRSRLFDDLDRLRRGMDRLLYSTSSPAYAPAEATRLSDIRPAAPPVNVYESPETFFVRLELPGADKDSLEVNMTGANLTVRGRYAEKSEEGQLIRAERPRGGFVRTVWVSPFADRDAIEASYRQGVLLVQMPKTKEAMPRRIEVKS